MRAGIGVLAAATCATTALAGAGSASAHASGGGAATMSPYATSAAIQILKRGGNAVDPAVAAATTLGVTEPFVAGPGGGGYFVYYRAKDHKVFTIHGREKAPAG